MRVIRERIFITHTAPDEREIVSEITILNQSDEVLHSIFLHRPEFMIGLKILDEKDNELPFYTNQFTRDLLSSKNKKDAMGGGPYSELLKKMEHQELYLLWIRLPNDEPLKGYESRIIKLCYQNQSKIVKLKFLESFEHQKFLFSIPKFRIENTKYAGDKYDIFYIITSPEGYSLDYKIIKKVKIIKDNEIELSQKQVPVNYNGRMLSIRTPAINEEIKFDMHYNVLPKSSERWFYTVTVFSMIGVSIILACLSSKTMDQGILSLISSKDMSKNISLILNTIQQHSDTLFGGIFTASLAAIGFMKNFSTNRTRFWFLIPMAISGIGFLIKNIT